MHTVYTQHRGKGPSSNHLFYLLFWGFSFKDPSSKMRSTDLWLCHMHSFPLCFLVESNAILFVMIHNTRGLFFLKEVCLKVLWRITVWFHGVFCLVILLLLACPVDVEFLSLYVCVWAGWHTSHAVLCIQSVHVPDPTSSVPQHHPECPDQPLHGSPGAWLHQRLPGIVCCVWVHVREREMGKGIWCSWERLWASTAYLCVCCGAICGRQNKSFAGLY